MTPPDPPSPNGADRGGVLADFQLRALIAEGAIGAEPAIEPGQVQPNSLDLRIGTPAFRTRCSFVPVGRPIEELLAEFSTNKTALGDAPGQELVLEPGQPYVVPLLERLRLPPGVRAFANPKSSTGRLDIMVRVLTDHGHAFDVIPEGYSGPLYLELISRSFPILIRRGDSLAQLRLLRGNAAIDDQELAQLVDRHSMILDPDGIPIPSGSLEFSEGVFLSLALKGRKDRESVGFSSKHHTGLVDLRERGLPIAPYWNRIHASSSRTGDPIILAQNTFYIFASRERVVVPADLCAEMVAIDVSKGEVRTHYAGFFDSGFGIHDGGIPGARVVLEVRNVDVPFLVQDRQKLFRLRFFRNLAAPTALYGSGRGSNYQGQGLKLAKQFSQPSDDSGDETQLPLRGLRF